MGNCSPKPQRTCREENDIHGCPAIAITTNDLRTIEEAEQEDEQELWCSIIIRSVNDGEERNMRLRRDDRMMKEVLTSWALQEPFLGYEADWKDISWTFAGEEIADDAVVTSLCLEEGAVVMVRGLELSYSKAFNGILSSATNDSRDPILNLRESVESIEYVKALRSVEVSADFLMALKSIERKLGLRCSDQDFLSEELYTRTSLEGEKLNRAWLKRQQRLILHKLGVARLQLEEARRVSTFPERLERVWRVPKAGG